MIEQLTNIARIILFILIVIIAYLVKFRTSTCSAISPNFKDGFSCFAYLQTIFYSFVTTPSAFAAPLF